MSNNPPYSVLELTEEEHNFLLENCDKNIAFGLANLQAIDHRPTSEKLIELMEKFKAVREKLRRARE